MKKWLAIVAALVVTIPAYAYDGWSTGKISKIRIQGLHGRILVNQENASNPGGCLNTDYLIMATNDNSLSKEMYSALLTAYASGKEVGLALKGCSSYPVITEVWLK